MTRTALGSLTSLALAAGLVVAPAARADQCAWIDDAVAQKAAALIREAGTIIEWCQPCQEARPGEPITVTSVEVHSVGEGQFRAVQVNGRDEDLAYLYVRSGNGWRNVSKAVGCPSTDVTSEFRLGSGGTVTPVAGKMREAVGTVVGVEEGENPRCILKSPSGRLELKPGADFEGRCRDLMGAEVRVKYTEELIPRTDGPGDTLVMHAAKVLRPERRTPRSIRDDDPSVP